MRSSGRRYDARQSADKWAGKHQQASGSAGHPCSSCMVVLSVLLPLFHGSQTCPPSSLQPTTVRPLPNARPRCHHRVHTGQAVHGPAHRVASPSQHHFAPAPASRGSSRRLLATFSASPVARRRVRLIRDTSWPAAVQHGERARSGALPLAAARPATTVWPGSMF